MLVLGQFLLFWGEKTLKFKNIDIFFKLRAIFILVLALVLIFNIKNANNFLKASKISGVANFPPTTLTLTLKDPSYH